MIAYCFASGEILFGQRVPRGAIRIASGPAKTLRKKVSAVARHAYDKRTLLVPGVVEAPNQMQGIKALVAFKNWIKPRFEEAGLTV
jgi:hypothetical protein